jgi:hypothetical protein
MIYEVSKDGQRFLINTQGKQGETVHVGHRELDREVEQVMASHPGTLQSSAWNIF